MTNTPPTMCFRITTVPVLRRMKKYIEESGTSAAAPVVAGIVALVWEYYPTLTYKQVAVLFLLEDIYINSDWNYPDGSIGGKKGEHDYGQMSWVVVKDNGEWKLKAGHNTTVDQKMKQFNPVK